MSTPIRQPRFRLGEQVFVNQATSTPPLFLPAVIAAGPGKAPAMRFLQVRYEDGRSVDVAVNSCHRDSPEFAAWHQTLLNKTLVSAQLLEICRREGLVFGGATCERLPEWTEYQRLNAALAPTGAAAFAVHPYGY